MNKQVVLWVLVFLMMVTLPAFLFSRGKQEAKEDVVTLIIWHDLGEKGVDWFNELEKLYPGDLKIKSVTYPTQQWIEKSIAALKTNTAPDLIFNNYERVIKVENQTGKMMDLNSVFLELDERNFLSDQDLQISMYGEKMLILPVQRVQMGFGVRKSWLENIGMEYPETWADTIAIAKSFNTKDPDGDGINGNTYGFALEAANPRDLIHMLDLFTFGTGLKHTIINPEGEIVINESRHKAVTKEVINVFRKYVPKDTINYSFTDMYQMIEGGKGGMFRVGDWNVNKWDGSDVLDGDYIIGEWPQFNEGEDNYVVIGGMRGVAVPDNSPHKEEALEFIKFMLSAEAQKASFSYVGASVRGDWDLDLSEHQKYFADPRHDLIAYDFPESIHSFYPAIEEIFHKELLNAIADPSLDMDKVLEVAEKKIKEYIKNN